MKFYMIEDWNDSNEKTIYLCRGESSHYNTYDMNNEDSNKMSSIIQRLDAIDAARVALEEEEKTLKAAGVELVVPYEKIRQQQQEEEQRRQKKERLEQEEKERKKRKEENEFQKGMKQSIIEWQRENKCRFPGFGC